jgi:glycosyltransferase involved in cell wall biosynthesis
MIPRVPATQIPEILSACDAGFISFNKTPLWEMTIPAKLQSYMACGKAIIASASGETRRVIEESDCGICCEIGDAEALAMGVKQMMTSDRDVMGTNARSYFEAHFSKSMLMDEMDTYIKRQVIE